MHIYLHYRKSLQLGTTLHFPNTQQADKTQKDIPVAWGGTKFIRNITKVYKNVKFGNEGGIFYARGLIRIDDMVDGPDITTPPVETASKDKGRVPNASSSNILGRFGPQSLSNLSNNPKNMPNNPKDSTGNSDNAELSETPIHPGAQTGSQGSTKSNHTPKPFPLDMRVDHHNPAYSDTPTPTRSKRVEGSQGRRTGSLGGSHNQIHSQSQSQNRRERGSGGFGLGKRKSMVESEVIEVFDSD